MSTRRAVQRLPPELRDQIAAGEVVERPSSVVKELVENSIDAGARTVVVEIEEGGLGLISVLDDGHGMTEADARLALERHATSKLERFDDLYALSTYGFRGEALPSVAAVSRLTLTTRVAESDEAVEVKVEGGAPPTIRPVGAPVGTRVAVRDLFFNVPPRRKFLKSVGTEAGHVSETVLELALGNPALALTLIRDGRVVRRFLRARQRADRARDVLGKEDQLVHAVASRQGLEVEALLSRPERARSGAVALHLLVNGRPVRDRLLARAVAMAYGSVLEPGRYPVGVVWIDVPSVDVDVNVHPQKAEVRFARGRALYDDVTRALGVELATSLRNPALRTQPQEPPTTIDEPLAGRVAADRGPATESISVPDGGAAHGRHAGPEGGARSDGHVGSSGRPSGAPAVGGEGAGYGDRPRVGSPVARGAAPAAVDAPGTSDGSSEVSSSVQALSSAMERAWGQRPAPSREEASDPWGLGPSEPIAPPRPTPRSETFSASSDQGGGRATPSSVREGGDRSESSVLPLLNLGAGQAVRSADQVLTGATERTMPGELRYGTLTFLAQVRCTYLLCEGEDGIYVLDQHAAAERVTFARLRASFRAREVARQQLLVPEVVAIAAMETPLVDEAREELLALGMDARVLGEGRVAVHGVPALVARADPRTLLRDLIDELSRTGARAFGERLDLVLATMACHGSVRAGDALHRDECIALLQSLDSIDFAGYCPHGRPIVTKLPFSELEKRVGRR